MKLINIFNRYNYKIINELQKLKRYIDNKDKDEINKSVNIIVNCIKKTDARSRNENVEILEQFIKDTDFIEERHYDILNIQKNILENVGENLYIKINADILREKYKKVLQEGEINE